MSQLKLNSAAHAATLKYTGTENVDIDCKNVALDDYTLLAEYTTRKYNGTITLSEPITNFKEMVVHGSYSTATTFTQFTVIPVPLMVVGQGYSLWGNYTLRAMWTYTSPTIFTAADESYSWIRAVYGRGRIA